MSRLGSAKRARVDIAWRGAMGLQVGTATPAENAARAAPRLRRTNAKRSYLVGNSRIWT